jgi:hypothetical protein
MLANATIEALTTLRLPGMVRGLLEQREHPDYAAVGFEERLGLLVDRELAERHNRRLQRASKPPTCASAPPSRASTSVAPGHRTGPDPHPGRSPLGGNDTLKWPRLGSL